jgi:hypothetical protein
MRAGTQKGTQTREDWRRDEREQHLALHRVHYSLERLVLGRWQWRACGEDEVVSCGRVLLLCTV